MASKSQSRTSSPKTPTRRPRLLRASATEPSLATSNASRNDLASLHCPSSRATTLLNRVASYSSAQQELAEIKRRSGSSSSRMDMCESPSSASEEGSGRGKERCERGVLQSGNYYSFPSFEDFQEYLENEDRK